MKGDHPMTPVADRLAALLEKVENEPEWGKYDKARGAVEFAFWKVRAEIVAVLRAYQQSDEPRPEALFDAVSALAARLGPLLEETQ